MTIQELINEIKPEGMYAYAEGQEKIALYYQRHQYTIIAVDRMYSGEIEKIEIDDKEKTITLI